MEKIQVLIDFEMFLVLNLLDLYFKIIQFDDNGALKQAL
jgi:hypothetical protein